MGVAFMTNWWGIYGSNGWGGLIVTVFGRYAQKILVFRLAKAIDHRVDIWLGVK